MTLIGAGLLTLVGHNDLDELTSGWCWAGATTGASAPYPKSDG
jgi:hypothetical protein